MSRRRRKKRVTGTGYLLILVLCIFGTISYARIELNQKREKVVETKEDLTNRLEEEKERTEDINEMSAYVQTKKYVEDMAREKFGLVYPDEILIKSEGSK